MTYPSVITLWTPRFWILVHQADSPFFASEKPTSDSIVTTRWM